MIRVVIYLALLFLIALGAAWMADRPGSVVITWLGYELQITLMVAVSALIAFVILTMVTWWAIRSIVGTPRFLANLLGAARRQRGHRALSLGMMAVGAGDVRRARRLADEAERLLEGDPAALLLKAQAAQLEGNRAAARSAFDAMLDNPQTKVLGLRGLFFEAQREGRPDAAYHFAREARDLSPDIGWAGTAVFEYQTATRQWEAALRTLESNAHARLIDKPTANRYRAVLLTARTLELESGEPDRAKQLALEAHKLAPDLVPAAVVAGRLLSRLGDIRRAMKVLETTWGHTPHPDISDCYAQVRPGDSARDRQKRVASLARMRANHSEGVFAIAQAAIEAQDWEEARKALEPMLRSAPTQRACLLMAEIEEGEHGDRGRVREWLSRAVHALRDPAWTADGVVSEDWAPISPVTGRLDAFEWRVPVESLAQDDPDTIEEDLLKPLSPIVPIARQSANSGTTTNPTLEADAAEPDISRPAISGTDDGGTEIIDGAIEPVDEQDTPPANASPPAAADEADGAENAENEENLDAETLAEDDPRMVQFPLRHAPDDPGAGKEAAEDANGRFRLF